MLDSLWAVRRCSEDAFLGDIERFANIVGNDRRRCGCQADNSLSLDLLDKPGNCSG